MSDEVKPPVAIRITRPYDSEEGYLDREFDTLSKTSVILLGAQSRPTGVILRFEIVLKTGASVLRGEGRVVGFKDKAYGGEAGLTLRFTRLDSKSKALVDRAAAMREARIRGSSMGMPAVAPPSLPVPPSAPRLASVPPPLPAPEPPPAPPAMSEPPPAPARPSTPMPPPPSSRRAPPPLPAWARSQAPRPAPPSPSPPPLPVQPAPVEPVDASIDEIDRESVRSVPRIPPPLPPRVSARPPALPPLPVAAVPAPAAAVPPRLAMSQETESPAPPVVVAAVRKGASAARTIAPPPDRDGLLGRLRARAHGLSSAQIEAILARHAP